MTGVAHVSYDVCINNCICFAEHPEQLSCPLCGEARYRRVGHKDIPRKTFDYIPVQHRLYSDPKAARDLKSYRKKLEDTAEGDVLRDFWDAKLCAELKKKGILTDPRSLAFYFSTDGVCLFRKGRQHTVHPLLLINLHPKLRFQKEIIFLGIIPGPKKPKDLLSFLRPVVDEFKVLASGVPAIDASIPVENTLLRSFQLHAYYICVVGADMPARDALMGLAGYNARNYCNYCLVRGIYSDKVGHIYCPLAPPRNSPPNPDWQTYDPLQLPLMDHTLSRQWAEHVARTGDDVTTRMTGIAKRTILWKLESIVFPWSYGLNAMHLFYQNVAPRMRDHWAGQFPLAKMDNSEDNAYLISQNMWRDIERDMERIIYPTAFGDKPRSPLAVRKAAEWKAWTKAISPVILQGRLPEPYYREWRVGGLRRVLVVRQWQAESRASLQRVPCMEERD